MGSRTIGSSTGQPYEKWQCRKSSSTSGKMARSGRRSPRPWRRPPVRTGRWQLGVLGGAARRTAARADAGETAVLKRTSREQRRSKEILCKASAYLRHRRVLCCAPQYLDHHRCRYRSRFDPPTDPLMRCRTGAQRITCGAQEISLLHPSIGTSGSEAAHRLRSISRRLHSGLYSAGSFHA